MGARLKRPPYSLPHGQFSDSCKQRFRNQLKPQVANVLRLIVMLAVWLGFYFVLLGVFLNNQLADTASWFEYTQLFTLARSIRKNLVQCTPSCMVSTHAHLSPGSHCSYGMASLPQPAQHIGQDRSPSQTSSCSTLIQECRQLNPSSITSCIAWVGCMAWGSQKTATQDHQVIRHTLWSAMWTQACHSQHVSCHAPAHHQMYQKVHGRAQVQS